MSDIKSPVLLYGKALLFVAIGTLAAALILVERPTLYVAVLLSLAIWAFARAYYFCFYVIQHYIDPAYRFAGLIHFAQYAAARDKNAFRTSAERQATVDRAADSTRHPPH